jgi:exopolyphosphatase/guanosine-5'-triphosphate,3'-diphosphate pyrophosphatase
MIAAVIDIGSNSALLLTVAIGADGRARGIDQALATTRLGTGLRPGGTLDAGARRRARDAVTAFAARARASGARRTWAFGTGAMRDAAGGRDFAAELAAASGVPVEVLSGEREARLAWTAAAGAVDAGAAPLVVADVGGWTTELTLGVGDRVLDVASLRLGALALGDAHGADLGRLVAAVDAALVLPARARGARLAASGGTATALAAVDLGLATYDPRRVHRHVLGRAALEGLVARLVAMPAEERGALPGLDPGRAAILPAGAVVLARIAAAVDAPGVTVSDHGVRHGYLRAALAAGGLHADLRELWP